MPKKEPADVTSARITVIGTITVAVIGVISALVVGYWQFILKPGAQIPSGDTEYVGRIVDINTQQPIAGAKVSLDLEGVPPIVYTDSEGVYRFKVVLHSEINGQIRVDAQNYQLYTRYIKISPDTKTIEDIRLIPIKQPQTTETTSPTNSSTASATSTEIPSFIGYNFETSTQGWNTSEGEHKRAILNTTTQVVYKGNHALVLDTELYGSGSLEFINHNKEDIYRHTEALVYFNQIPEGIDYPGPYDLTGKRLSCFVYLPIGLVVPDNTPPAYIRLIIKDKNFANQFSEAVMITNKTVERWLELIYVVNSVSNSGFDTTQVNAMGVRIDSLDNSIINYKGSIFIDYCTIDF